jgi:topoisomerase-4 subunit A
MAYIKDLFDENFLEYASYVIKDRAIPYLEDGLKPVQRRILHSLFEMDDGKFNKVANVVGHCMKYHPHGDASIYSALVVLSNKENFIDKQGNFGNIFTGDPASAARYIECRLRPMAREVLYNPEITEYQPSYDGRNKEPVTFPAKLPIVVIQGAEGIAVGMATKILPHNFIEVISAVKASLNGEYEQLLPDFPTGGLVDVCDYSDGIGKVLTRAKIEIVDNKTVVIRELPFGSTTETLINSIDLAAKKNKVMVTSINDFSTDKVEIELKLKRGFHAKEIVEALYAFSDCEKSISVNSLIIQDNQPVVMPISKIVEYSALQLKDILRRELELERSKLEEKLHRRNLELIFVSERIYKHIETQKTVASIKQAVLDGFIPFSEEVKDEITDEDLEHLLRIPIRRISIYDIEKAYAELKEISDRIKEINKLLNNLVTYALEWLDKMIAKYAKFYPRKTELISMSQTSAKEAAIRDRDLRYNGNQGYVGYDLKDGPKKFKVSVYDKILYIDRDGNYQVIEVPEKKFLGFRLRYIGLTDVETIDSTIFTAIYRSDAGHHFVKRFRIDKFIANKDYSIIPAGATLVDLITVETGIFTLKFVPTKTMRKFEATCDVSKYAVKGVGARGNKITDKDIAAVDYKKISKDGENEEPTAKPEELPLFGATDE